MYNQSSHKCDDAPQKMFQMLRQNAFDAQCDLARASVRQPDSLRSTLFLARELRMYCIIVAYFLPLQKLQDMEEKRIARLAVCMETYAEVDRQVLPIVGKCLDGMTKAATSVEPKAVGAHTHTHTHAP